MNHPTDRIAHTTVFVTPVVEHWLEREIAQWVHPMKDRSDQFVYKVKKECYLIRQDNSIYKFSVKLSFSIIGQEKSKLQKQISKFYLS